MDRLSVPVKHKEVVRFDVSVNNTTAVSSFYNFQQIDGVVNCHALTNGFVTTLVLVHNVLQEE